MIEGYVVERKEVDKGAWVLAGCSSRPGVEIAGFRGICNLRVVARNAVGWSEPIVLQGFLASASLNVTLEEEESLLEEGASATHAGQCSASSLNQGPEGPPDLTETGTSVPRDRAGTSLLLTPREEGDQSHVSSL